MKRIEGTAIVAWWFIASAALTLARLVGRGGEIIAHPDGRQAAIGPFIVAVLSLGAAWQLLRTRRTSALATGLVVIQVIALSAGPLAYRLDAGPFLRVSLDSAGVITNFGNDARLLLVLGSANRVPSGLAVNILALAALTVLIASTRTPRFSQP